MNCGTSELQYLTGQLMMSELNKTKDSEIILIKLSDIDKSNCIVVDNIILKLSLFDGKKVIRHPIRSLQIAQIRRIVAADEYTNAFEHKLLFDFGRTPKSELFINAINTIRGKFVAIVINKEKSKDKRYRVYGWDNGLAISKLENTYNNEGYCLELESIMVESSPSPKLVFDTDEKTTYAIIDKLANSLETQQETLNDTDKLLKTAKNSFKYLWNKKWLVK